MTPPIDQRAGPSPLQWFLAEIDRVPDGHLTGSKVRELLRAMAGQRMQLCFRDLHHAERVRQATAMLCSGVSATDVRKRVGWIFSVSRTTSKRIVAEAINRRAGTR